MVIGEAIAHFCPECFGYHFVGIAPDGWVLDADDDGEPLDGQAVAAALLERHMSGFTVLVA